MTIFMIGNHKNRNMFKQGQLVKSKVRTDVAQLFVMVLKDISPTKIQFNGVIIKDNTDSDGSEDTQRGFITNSWNTDMFEECSWDEVKPFIF